MVFGKSGGRSWTITVPMLEVDDMRETAGTGTLALSRFAPAGPGSLAVDTVDFTARTEIGFSGTSTLTGTGVACESASAMTETVLRYEGFGCRWAVQAAGRA